MPKYYLPTFSFITLTLLFTTGCFRMPTITPPALPPAASIPITIDRPLDWNNLTQSVRLSNGLTAASCGGDAPIVCLYRDNQPIGHMELLTYDITGTTTTLLARTEDYYRSISADRHTGCPAGYNTHTYPVTTSTVAGLPGIIAKLEVTRETGTPVEEYTLYMAERGNRLFVFNVSGYEAGACIGDDEAPYTTINNLDHGAREGFAALVASSILPPE